MTISSTNGEIRHRKQYSAITQSIWRRAILTSSINNTTTTQACQRNTSEWPIPVAFIVEARAGRYLYRREARGHMNVIRRHLPMKRLAEAVK